MSLRREFDLLPEDLVFLEEYGLPWEAIVDGSHWMPVHDFPAPDGYRRSAATAAVRIESGYPGAPLDMVYFTPALERADGKPIGATNVVQQIDGRPFQRWSRHRTPANPWVAGEDNLSTHIQLVEDWLEREFRQ